MTKNINHAKIHMNGFSFLFHYIPSEKPIYMMGFFYCKKFSKMINLGRNDRNVEKLVSVEGTTRINREHKRRCYNMTREEVKTIFPDATDEQVNAFLDKNSRDIGKAKGDGDKHKEEVERLKQQISEKDNAIAEMEKAKGDADKIAAELEKYKQAEADRQAAEQAEQEKAAKTERFKTAKGEREFSSQFAESGVMNAFFEALSNPDNTGKGDAEIFDSLTKDIDGIFKNPQQQKVTVPAAGGTNFSDEQESRMRQIMGLPPKKE